MPPRQPQRVLVVSPHLDDGVLSLGAYLAGIASQGAKVTVLTIFGGDPTSPAPAGRWDARAGFQTAGEASRRRREEDRAACALLGAGCEWLSFLDGDYGSHPTEESVWERVESHVDSADFVFVPGRPLVHPDHAWVSSVAAEHADPMKLVFYAELPYDLWPPDKRRGSEVAELARRRTWMAPRAPFRTRVLKWRAAGAYSTQLPWLARPGYRTAVLRSRIGHEQLAWPDS